MFYFREMLSESSSGGQADWRRQVSEKVKMK